MIKELELNEKQQAIVHAIEDLMQEAFRNNISFVSDQYRNLYAYNNQNVSCFDAPADAAYERKETMQLQELPAMQARVDYVPTNEDIFVGFSGAA